MSLLADVQVMSTSTAPILAQQGHPDFLADDYVTEPLDYAGGQIPVPQRPGIGVEIDRDKLARYHAQFLEEGMAFTTRPQAEAPAIYVPAY